MDRKQVTRWRKQTAWMRRRLFSGRRRALRRHLPRMGTVHVSDRTQNLRQWLRETFEEFSYD